MAKVTVDARIIEESLVNILEKVATAVDWIKKKKGQIRLEVPEPYRHLIGPASRVEHCLAPSRPDECNDVGIMIGMFDKLSASRARRNDRKGK